jgi:hypothetical protein
LGWAARGGARALETSAAADAAQSIAAAGCWRAAAAWEG